MAEVFLHQRLRELLTERGIPREQFALDIDKSYGTVMKLLGGTIRPSLTTFAAIVHVLNKAAPCSADELLGGGVDDRPTDMGPEIDAWVQDVLPTLPPMSADQARRVSAVLFPATRVEQAKAS